MKSSDLPVSLLAEKTRPIGKVMKISSLLSTKVGDFDVLHYSG